MDKASKTSLATCDQHRLRYDPSSSSGCVLCRRDAEARANRPSPGRVVAFLGALALLVLAAAALWKLVVQRPARDAAPVAESPSAVAASPPFPMPTSFSQVTRLFVPAGGAPARGWPVIVLLHGHGSTKENLQPIGEVATKQGIAAIAVAGPVAAGSGARSWPHEVEHTHLYLTRILELYDGRAPLDSNRVLLGGFSMGAFHAALLVAAHPDVYAGALAVSPVGAVHGNFNATQQKAPLFVLVGRRDKGALATSDSLQRMWWEAKQPVRRSTYEGGHAPPSSWHATVGEAIAWLAKGG